MKTVNYWPDNMNGPAWRLQAFVDGKLVANWWPGTMYGAINRAGIYLGDDPIPEHEILARLAVGYRGATIFRLPPPAEPVRSDTPYLPDARLCEDRTAEAVAIATANDWL